MPNGNQDDPRESPPPPASSPLEAAAADEGPSTRGWEPALAGPPPSRTLLPWLVLLVVFGVGGVLFQQPESAVLAALAGLLVAAQASDLYPELTVLYYVTSWIVPVGGIAACAALAGLLGASLGTGGTSPGALAACVFGVLAIVPSAFTAPGAFLARRLLHEPNPTSRYARLVARLVVVSFVVGLCGIAAYPQLYQLLTESTEPLFESHEALGGIAGYVLVAFAAVGYLVRRDLRATLERLGLGLPSPRHLLLVPLGVVVLLALNAGAEALESRFFPALAEADRRMTEIIAGDIGLAGALVLGLTAGLGEEITLRGALQPRLGIVLTSLVFAVFHVQYTWFGIAVVFAIGLVFGVIRRWSCTTIAIAVHAVYDIVVALSLRAS